MTTTAAEVVYVETSGTNCTIYGEHGYVTELHHDGKHLVGAFVHIPPETAANHAPGHMLYVRLGRGSGERRQWREVLDARHITRDEFDRITGLEKLRREMGWRA